MWQLWSKRRLWVGAWLWCAVVAVAARAESPATKPVEPPALTHYKGREIAQTMHYTGAAWLTRESREREEDCRTLLRELGLKPGMVVCDLGCGNGFYTLKMAEMVRPGGKVIAEDIQKPMLTMLQKRAREAGVTNIETVLGTTVDPKLAEGSIDLMLVVDVYHELDHPEEMLGAIRRSLKPGGRMALVEFRAEDPDVPIKPLHKISKEQVLKEIPPNGFKLVREFDGLPWQHLMFFEGDEKK
jgi:2-polyprenyl-3-methyl-5-hydroxy-6-metoxy-1,4-benzoquinol methylase